MTLELDPNRPSPSKYSKMLVIGSDGFSTYVNNALVDYGGFSTVAYLLSLI